MCTATTLTGPARALITFNRDELIEREPEIPPAAFGPPAARWLAPLDSQAGGTWIAVNSAGLVLSLMNGYRESSSSPTAAPGSSSNTLPTPVSSSGLPSRGAIIPALMPLRSRLDALDFLVNRFDSTPYASFRLTLVDRTGVSEFIWDGRALQPPLDLPQPWCFQSSSSWRQDEVVAWRTEAFETWLARDASFDGALPAIHLLQPAGMEAWAPLMRRHYAMTRSITQIELDWSAASAEMRYWPLPPGQQIVAPPHIARLAL